MLYPIMFNKQRFCLLDGDSLGLLDLGVTPDVMRVFLLSANDGFSGNISSPSAGFPLIGTHATRFNASLCCTCHTPLFTTRTSSQVLSIYAVEPLP